MMNAGPRQSRTRSPGGPIRSTRERKPSPYSSGPYLSPPSDTGWRRTNSDSALHQSAMQVDNRVDSRNYYVSNLDYPFNIALIKQWFSFGSALSSVELYQAFSIKPFTVSQPVAKSIC